MIQITLKEYLARQKRLGRKVPTMTELAKISNVTYSTLARTASNRYGARVNLNMLSGIIWYLRREYHLDTQLTDIMTFEESLLYNT